jgi:hypothetical protein
VIFWGAARASTLSPGARDVIFWGAARASTLSPRARVGIIGDGLFGTSELVPPKNVRALLSRAQHGLGVRFPIPTPFLEL